VVRVVETATRTVREKDKNLKGDEGGERYFKGSWKKKEEVRHEGPNGKRTVQEKRAKPRGRAGKGGRPRGDS